MPSWPSNLPTINADAQEEILEGFIKSPTSIGPGKRRRRYSATPHFFGGTFTFTRAQRATFDTFYHVTLAEGSLPFTMDDPATGNTATFAFVEAPMFLLKTGDGTAASVFEMKAALERLP